MEVEFEPYSDRKIEFRETVVVNDFHVKMYTITRRANFESGVTLNAAKNKLQDWIDEVKASSIPTHKNAFLIVHEAREGVLILLNWWTGENMLETTIHFSSFDNPLVIQSSIYHPKQLVCIWELEIFHHERKGWIQHVLSKSPNPDFISYQNDVLNQ